MCHECDTAVDHAKEKLRAACAVVFDLVENGELAKVTSPDLAGALARAVACRRAAGEAARAQRRHATPATPTPLVAPSTPPPIAASSLAPLPPLGPEDEIAPYPAAAEAAPNRSPVERPGANRDAMASVRLAPRPGLGGSLPEGSA